MEMLIISIIYSPAYAIVRWQLLKSLNFWPWLAPAVCIRTFTRENVWHRSEILQRQMELSINSLLYVRLHVTHKNSLSVIVWQCEETKQVWKCADFKSQSFLFAEEIWKASFQDKDELIIQNYFMESLKYVTTLWVSFKIKNLRKWILIHLSRKGRHYHFQFIKHLW